VVEEIKDPNSITGLNRDALLSNLKEVNQRLTMLEKSLSQLVVAFTRLSIEYHNNTKKSEPKESPYFDAVEAVVKALESGGAITFSVAEAIAEKAGFTIADPEEFQSELIKGKYGLALNTNGLLYYKLGRS
jgi:hypothetical protein